VVQTLLFTRGEFTPRSARAWATRHGFKGGFVDGANAASGALRIRQRDPNGFSRLRTVALTRGVKAVVGWERC
jgi:hypothetical protein